MHRGRFRSLSWVQRQYRRLLPRSKIEFASHKLTFVTNSNQCFHRDSEVTQNVSGSVFPNARMFSLRSMNSQRARSSTRDLFKDGIARKSKVSRLLTTSNFAWRMRRSVARRSRSSSSSSLSPDRSPKYLGISC